MNKKKLAPLEDFPFFWSCSFLFLRQSFSAQEALWSAHPRIAPSSLDLSWSAGGRGAEGTEENLLGE